MLDDLSNKLIKEIDLTKGLSDLKKAYVPDFGYKEMMTFGESSSKPNQSSWSKVKNMHFNRLVVFMS